MLQPLMVHGGPDARGAAAHDFSTNANACGPCPAALAAVRDADPSRYPDPIYTALREQLGALHGVAPGRIVPAASASEFVVRMTAAVSGAGQGTVQVPAHGYGDYARAAQAQGTALWHGAGPAPADLRLVWACEPSSPLGQPQHGLAACLADRPAHVPLVLDRAYAPLRLQGESALSAAQLDRCWQLWSPNKALGMTGVRGAYAIAPLDAPTPLVQQLAALSPSWPLGAHAVAMLLAWAQPETQGWLAASLPQLRDWKARQVALCQGLGWEVLPSETNFFCARVAAADAGALGERLQRLRAHGVQLRDCASFGLAGHVRLAALAPRDQHALALAWAAG